MELSEKAEEILETLWVRLVEEKQASAPLTEVLLTADVPERRDVMSGGPVKELVINNCITVSDGRAELTDRGRPLAENVVRRHRLAERLLADVLGGWNETTDEKACKFEHLLDRGLDDSICSLLGHPKVCPHGKPIPPGKCCEQMRSSSSRVVAPLSQLVEGQNGKVAYIYAPKLNQLQKLTAMGILPGASISVLQSFPAYVFQAGQTQFAVDREIADAIYVRLTYDDVPSGELGRGPQAVGHRPRRFGWGRGRRSGPDTRQP